MENYSERLKREIRERIVNNLEQSINLVESEQQGIPFLLGEICEEIKFLADMANYIDHAVSQGIKFNSYNGNR